MKKLFLVVFLGLSFIGCKENTYQSPDGSLPESFVPYASPYLGTYQTSKGQTVILSFNDQKLSLTTNFDVIDQRCQSQVGVFKSVTAFPSKQDSFDSSEPFEADFALNVGKCTWIATHVATFHFNQALNHKDIFQLVVVLSPEVRDSRGGKPGVTRTWNLHKVN